jgi:hypothetical protein
MFDEKASIYPNAPLSPFFAPIRKLLEKRVHLTPQVRRLAILATRFEDRIRCANVDWDVPLSADFTLLNLVERYTPETLAKKLTDETWNAFRRISPADFLDADTPHMRRITQRWSCLCNDTATFVASDSKLFPYMTKLAEVRQCLPYISKLTLNRPSFTYEITTMRLPWAAVSFSMGFLAN